MEKTATVNVKTELISEKNHGIMIEFILKNKEDDP